MSYLPVKFSKCLFTNIQKQQNKLKIVYFLKKYRLYGGLTREFLGLRTRNFQDIISGYFCLSLFSTFRTNVRMSIIRSHVSFCLVSIWSLNLNIDKKSNATCITASLCSTLFSLWFKFSSNWFYFLSKSTKERGKKLTRKNLNEDSSSKM